MVEALVIGGAVGVLVALVVALGRRRRRRGSAPGPDAGRRGMLTVTLDLSVDQQDPEPARRLADAAAAPLFEDDPDLEQVEVRDRAGVLLAIIERAEGIELAERDPFAGGADRLALPAAVRGELPEAPSLAEVVAAILTAAGHHVDVDGDVVRAGDRAVVALEATDPDALSAAFLRYRASGARTGVVVSRRTVPASEVQRRELLAPDLRYARAGALQRMADALAVDGDPIDFALGPPVSGR